MKKVLTIMVLLFLAIGSKAQTTKQKYADQLFAQCNYYEAGKVYSELSDNMIKKGTLDSTTLIKAGQSLYNSRKYSEAVKYYSRVYRFSGFNTNNEQQYLDALIRTSNYNMIKEYISWKGGNILFGGKDLSEIETVQSRIKNDTSGYQIKEASFNSNEGDYGAVLYDSTIYFCSSRNDLGFTHDRHGWDNIGFSNLFSIKNGKPEYLEYNTELHDGPICFTSDYKTAYATRTEFIKRGNALVKHVKVFVLRMENGRVVSEEEFIHNGDWNTGHITLSSDEETIYFASDRPGGMGGSDIYYSQLENGKWGPVQNMGNNINTTGDELFPFITDDVLYFSSNGHIGLGGLDVYSANIYSNDSPKNLGASINSNQDDFAFNVSADEISGYLSSDRNSNIDRIYSVKIAIAKGTLIVKAKDKIKNKEIKEATIWLIDRATNDSTLIAPDASGNYSIPIEGKKDYIIVGSKKNYELDAPVYLNTDNLTNNEVVEKDLLFNETHYDLVVKTVIKGTGEICPGVKGVFTDPITKTQVSFTTGDDGTTLVNIENLHTYEVTAQKKGYIDLNEIVQTNSEVLIELDLQMLEIKKDVTFEIKNILYDLAKWDLRPESKVELDKLVEFLKVNDNIKVELSSHTDSRASKKYNQDLSQKRAQSCVDYLISKGIDKNRIVAKGYGEEKLLNGCSDGVTCTEEDHQRNRRTEIKILSVN